MDLNKLYFDHQISLMRANATGCDRIGLNHRANAATIARRIERAHRESGATVLRNWEARCSSDDRQPDMGRTPAATGAQ